MLHRLISFFLLICIKLFSHTFFKLKQIWLGEPAKDWNKIKLIVFLNHTSLFEPLFIAAFPWSQLWRIASHLVAPGADITLKRPLVGKIYKFLSPHIVAISRQRDATWDLFIQKIHHNPKSVVLILPEGRMKRLNGLDKEGKPMSVRGGIADILLLMGEGEMLLAYSGGLHHIHYPGKLYPNLFKSMALKSETLSIIDYKNQFDHDPEDSKIFKNAVTEDLEKRIKRHC
jgi:hypothetical protein